MAMAAQATTIAQMQSRMIVSALCAATVVDLAVRSRQAQGYSVRPAGANAAESKDSKASLTHRRTVPGMGVRCYHWASVQSRLLSVLDPRSSAHASAERLLFGHLPDHPRELLVRFALLRRQGRFVYRAILPMGRWSALYHHNALLRALLRRQKGAQSRR